MYAGSDSLSDPSPYASQLPMLGPPGITRPLKSSYWAAECTTRSPKHDRTTAISSTTRERCGNRSETSIPLSPHLRKVRVLASNFAPC